MKSITNNRIYSYPIVCLLLMFVSVCSYAETKVAAEYQVKAAFLINFAKFVEWPSESLNEASQEIILGIVGDDPFKDEIEAAAGKSKVQNRTLVVKRFKNKDDIEFCHILFICSSEKKNLNDIKNKISNWDVLTISEVDGFAEKGVVINFKTVAGKIRFEINEEAADSADIKVSSQLMKLGILVKSKQSEVLSHKKRNFC